ncbi:bacterio-opsin activator domain-containing protein [Halostella litorea]|uniref:bacterio-opsin activator domain-containing protein n=1 Tax=Halostella litorea TaxID=2528831 RepID=UPI00109223DB|nr:bacterio-opsin activator domain-containing protein [Halostella litorea]
MGSKNNISEVWADVVDALPGAVGIQADGRFVSVSAELASLLGSEADTLVGEPWRAAFDDEGGERLAAAVEQAHAAGRWEGRVRAGGGARLELTLTVTDGGTLVWSATEAEDDPPGGAASETGFATDPHLAGELLDGMHAVAFTLDGQGRLDRWNGALPDRTGYDHADLDGMAVERLVASDHHARLGRLHAEGRGVELDLRTADGKRLAHEVRETTVSPEDGGAVRCLVCYDIADRSEDIKRYETILETVVDGVYTLDENLEFTYVNEEMSNIFERPASELLGTDPRTLFADESQMAMAADMRERVVEGDLTTGTVEARTETASGETVELESNYRLRHDPEDGEFPGSVGIIRDVTERNQRERTLERQRNELETLDRITHLLLETTRESLKTASRDSVERAVCERLVASDLYQFAWIGDREFDGDRIVPRASAGDDRGYLDAIADADGVDQWPENRALRSRSIAVATSADGSDGGWPEAASDRGFEATIAVPLRDGDAVYGVLVVYATHEGAFGDRARAGFDVLGRAVGSVIYAANNRELLFADAVVELGFRVPVADSMLARIATEFDCSIALDGYVSAGPQWVLYLSVDGAEVDGVVDELNGETGVERARVVPVDGEGGRVELVMSTSPLLDTITSVGATVRDASGDATGVRLTVEAPADSDVRDIVDHVRAEYDGADLVSTREYDRDVTTVGRPDGVLDELTERQREAVQAAYRAGYFDWPRASTAEAVAASLNIAPPTLHGHLRKAQRAILSTLIEQ